MGRLDLIKNVIDAEIKTNGQRSITGNKMNGVLLGIVDAADAEIKVLESAKVDKEDGKGLSSNDYTTEEKQKLASLENYDDSKVVKDVQDLQTTKQDVISDIEQIRTNAESAIKEIPAEYATQTYVNEAISSAIIQALNTEV